MRLIIKYYEGDGYTYSCETIVPIEYDSAEQLLIDMETMVNTVIEYDNNVSEAWSNFNIKWNAKNRKPEAEFIEAYTSLSAKFSILNRPCRDFGGINLGINVDSLIENGKFIAPDIYTVDEWFASEGLQ